MTDWLTVRLYPRCLYFILLMQNSTCLKRNCLPRSGRLLSSLPSSAGERQDAERCDVTYGDVIDKAARKNVSICRRAEQDGGLSRVYVSQSNLLHIVFAPAASAHRQQQQHNFIVHVEGYNFKLEQLQSYTFEVQLRGCSLTLLFRIMEMLLQSVDKHDV